MKSKTPVSDNALSEYLPAFRRNQDARLDSGKRTYGDASFGWPVKRLLREAQQECEDIPNYAFIAWTRLEKLMETAEAIEDMLPGKCPKHPKYTPDKPPRVCCERCWMAYSVRTVQRDMLDMP